MGEFADYCLGEVLDPYWGGEPIFDLFPFQEEFFRRSNLVANQEQDARRVITPIARLSFPHLFKKAPPMEGQGPDQCKYGCNLIFPKGTDLSKLEAAVEAAKAAKWPNGKVPKFRYETFKDAGEMEYDGYEDGMIFISAKSGDRPGIIIGPNREICTEEADVYAGCWVKASVTAFGYDMQANKGVSFALNNIWKIRDGESFTGRRKAEEDFADEEVDPEAFGDEELAESML
jgi:hypothetical protein